LDAAGCLAPWGVDCWLTLYLRIPAVKILPVFAAEGRRALFVEELTAGDAIHMIVTGVLSGPEPLFAVKNLKRVLRLRWRRGHLPTVRLQPCVCRIQQAGTLRMPTLRMPTLRMLAGGGLCG